MCAVACCLSASGMGMEQLADAHCISMQAIVQDHMHTSNLVPKELCVAATQQALSGYTDIAASHRLVQESDPLQFL